MVKTCLVGKSVKVLLHRKKSTYSSAPNNCAANLINFLKKSNLHALFKDLHVYQILRQFPAYMFIDFFTLTDFRKENLAKKSIFLANSVIFSYI